MFRQEFKKAFFNKKIIFLIILSILLLLFSAYKDLKDYIFLDYNAPDIRTFEDLQSIKQMVYNTLNKYNIWTSSMSIYSLFMPFLVTLCYATSYFDDISSKFIQFIDFRINHKKYVFIKYMVNGIMGGLSLVIPPLIYFILLCIFGHGDIYTASAAIGGLFDDILHSNPLVYLCIYFTIQFLFGFTYSTIALSISTLIKNKIAIILSPVVYFFIMTFVTENLNLRFMMPSNVTQFWAIAGGITRGSIFFQLIITTIVFSLIFFTFSRKECIYE
ncbi:hypothetical protein ABE450_002143 [Clostridium perfringens]|uniref:Putative membrane-spanning permease n=4 Tax=Clostridium perfringens TaxID=1502 RepID=A0A2X2VCT1_CLOPF|nr:hypothetical protein [Clostridium perfringens]EJT5917582.1 hypothetical protein [Clostridium perfringens]EJT6136273.1 hypothetical protein [Clostridium perfringens]EJT6472013.1 hypothetical protein [Clostridium perfringens]MDH5086562.1 ABC-2 family transporter protein [Clostridium perfringens]MDK0889712.1 hypothetical protein [Clostridium perfringens]